MTILIVDDHASFRAFMRTMLDDEGFDVIGDVSDGEAAVAAAMELHPDDVLLDVHLGNGIDGFEVARRLADLPEPPNVVLTSSRDQEAYVSRIADAPVLGFLSKDELSGNTLATMFGHPLDA